MPREHAYSSMDHFDPEIAAEIEAANKARAKLIESRFFAEAIVPQPLNRGQLDADLHKHDWAGRAEFSAFRSSDENFGFTIRAPRIPTQPPTEPTES